MHILCEIDTNPITSPIDAHQRWRSIPTLSHIPCGQIQVPHLLTHTYTLHPAQNTSNTGDTKNILSFYIKIKYTIYYDKTTFSFQFGHTEIFPFDHSTGLSLKKKLIRLLFAQWVSSSTYLSSKEKLIGFPFELRLLYWSTASHDLMQATLAWNKGN